MSSESGRRTDARGSNERGANALVSVEGAAADRPLVGAAGRFVAGTGGRLTVLNVMPSGAFADRQRARARVAGLPAFTLAAAEAERRRAATRVADEALDGVPVDYDCVGAVGREPARVLAEARARDCRRVFLADRRRSSLGAVVAGEVIAEVTSAFEGSVTVVGESSERRESERVGRV